MRKTKNVSAAKVKGDSRMGNLLRRVLAFVLGVVFTISAASASVVGGAYWAYKNIKPVGIASDDPG